MNGAWAAWRIEWLYVVLLAIFISGCFRPAGTELLQLDPHLVALLEFRGSAWTTSPEKTLSPDGKYALLVRSDPDGMHLSAIFVGSRTNPGSQGDVTPKEAQEIVLDSATKSWTQNNLFGYYPLGWISKDKCLFVIFGWMKDGPNEGKRGLSIREGDIGNKKSYELVFEEVPDGYYKSGAYIAEKGKAYLTLVLRGRESSSCTIKEYDTQKKQIRLIKGDLPSYDGLFDPRLSPDGKYFVYSIYEPGRSGVYILDTATGEEKPLIPRGETASFLPSWSSDGQYVAVYTSSKLEGHSGNNLLDYNVFPAEDGPMPIGESITVVDTNGNVVKDIQIEGKFISGFRWARNSKTLGFLAGPERKPDSQESSSGLRDITFESAWLFDLARDKEPVRIADISKIAKDRYVYPVSVTPDGNGLFFNVYSEDGLATWYSGKGKSSVQPKPEEPIAISQGVWEAYRDVSFGNSLVATIQGPDKTSLFLLSPDKFQKLAEFQKLGPVTILAFNRDIMAVYKGNLGEDPSDEAKSQIYVYRMTK